MFNVQEFTAEKILVQSEEAFLTGLKEKTAVGIHDDYLLRKQIRRMVTYIHAMPREKISVHKKWPADWWQAFRARWFPRWWLRRYPVRYDRVDIEQTIYGPICPHLFHEDQFKHLRWMTHDIQPLPDDGGIAERLG